MASVTTEPLSEQCVKHVIDKMMESELRRKVLESTKRDPYHTLRADAEKLIDEMSNLELIDLIGKVLSAK